MLKSEQKYEAPIDKQICFWNRWNINKLPQLVKVSMDEVNVIINWLHKLSRTNLDIIEIGCSTGWMCESLTRFGNVTGIDLSDKAIEIASMRVPSVKFFAGDFVEFEFSPNSYDVAVCLEVLSHVSNQSAFIKKISDILRNDGYLMLATQNRPALEKNDIPPPGNGQIRRWLDRHELFQLLSEQFEIIEMFSITPQFNVGFLRYLNSRKLHKVLSRIGLGFISKLIKNTQERAWLGFTLMALARKRTIK